MKCFINYLENVYAEQKKILKIWEGDYTNFFLVKILVCICGAKKVTKVGRVIILISSWSKFSYVYVLKMYILLGNSISKDPNPASCLVPRLETGKIL